MARKPTHFVVPTPFLTTTTALLLLLGLILPTTVTSRSKPVPSDSSKLESWINHNIKEYNQRKAEIARGVGAILDPKLSKAEECVKVIKVRKDGSGDFETVFEAVNSIPDGNKKRRIIWIGGGKYREKFTVNQSKPFVTFYGSPDDIPTIEFDGTASEFGTVYSATVAVDSDYFMAVNIAFVNTAPMPDGIRKGAQAVAMRISGNKAAFYNCSFIGFQDTLCDDRGKHFFQDCFIQGTVDFIFGDGKSIYLNTEIRSVANGMGVITAHARVDVNDNSGFTFVHCKITGSGSGNNNTYLGRAWKERPRVVFAYTYMDTVIKTEGWSNNMHAERDKTVYYGEYKCKGPGASETKRASFARILNDEEATPFLSMTYIHGNKWLLPPPKLSHFN